MLADILLFCFRKFNRELPPLTLELKLAMRGVIWGVGFFVLVWVFVPCFFGGVPPPRPHPPSPPRYFLSLSILQDFCALLFQRQSTLK